MNLSKLLAGVTVTKMFQTLYGKMVVTHDVEVRRIRYDSRSVEQNDLFVAITGHGADGHRYIPDAIDRGAKVVILENDGRFPDSYFMHAGVVKIVVPNARVALAQVAANYYDHPARALTMVGVTGTNGKTTVTHIIQSMLEASGQASGLIGTIEYRVRGDVFPASHTTPESLEINGLLRSMVDHECTAAVMEVSSHALHQHRVEGLEFRAAVFTNLTQDHLDYHATMEEYAAAKRMLFTSLAPSSYAVVNADDAWGSSMSGATRAQTISYGTKPGADVLAGNVALTMNGTNFTVNYKNTGTSITSPLIGRFNVSNILAAYATGLALGIPSERMQHAIAGMRAVRGRFETYASQRGWTAVIDYAHTPDALAQALAAVKDIMSNRKGRIITVFGCGGNRDRTKRPKMGVIAAELSDLAIVTSDNPRHEDPLAIIEEVMSGIPQKANVEQEVDRGRAIVRALSAARKDDVILIAGKGHEEYQVVGDEKIHFSDREAVEDFIRSHA